MNIIIYDHSIDTTVISLFTRVFTDSEGKQEGEMIGELVTNLINTTESADLIGFVVYENKTIIGALFFSRIIMSNNKIGFLLSPMAVSTSFHGKGLGQQLIQKGLEYLKSKNVDVVITYGDPKFYSKVGFQQISNGMIIPPYELSFPHGWLAQSLKGTLKDLAHVEIQCVNAFNHQHYW